MEPPEVGEPAPPDRLLRRPDGSDGPPRGRGAGPRGRPWGEPLDPEDVADALAQHDPDLFGFVHAETSTGVRQPDVSALTALSHDHGALVIADVVTSLGVDADPDAGLTATRRHLRGD